MTNYLSRLSALLLLPILLIACATDTTTNPDANGGNIKMQAELSSRRVTAIAEKGGRVLAGATVDSLVITNAKFMVSEIKLQRKDAGTEEKFKTGPVILSVDQNGAKLVTTGSLPTGIYNKVNFKFHRLNDQEIQPWTGNADFTDFVTADRHTIILEGIVYVNGQALPFRYGSKVEEDLKFDLAEFVVSEGTQTILVVRLETPAVFKDKDTGEVLDPRDSENQNRIDDAIKAALNAVRK
jgi:hypothetical protein